MKSIYIYIGAKVLFTTTEQQQINKYINIINRMNKIMIGDPTTIITAKKYLQDSIVTHWTLSFLFEAIFKTFAMENMFARGDSSMIQTTETYGTHIIV